MGGNATQPPPPRSRGVPSKGNQIRIGYITPPFSEVHKWGKLLVTPPFSGVRSKGDKLATSPLHSPGATSGLNCYETPMFLGVYSYSEKTRDGYLTCALSGATYGGNVYVTVPFSGNPNKGGKIRMGYLSPAFSGAHKRAESLRNPSILGGP